MSLRFRQKVQAVPRQADLRLIQVAAGILRDASGRVLLAERVDGGPFHGLWEFPGGKIHEHEAPEQALARELIEEIGITPLAAESFMSIAHKYSDRHVAIEFFLVSEWKDEPVGAEGQALKWVNIEDLYAEDLLPADTPVVEALKILDAEHLSADARN